MPRYPSNARAVSLPAQLATAVLAVILVASCDEPEALPSELRTELQAIVDEKLGLVGSPGLTLTVAIPGHGSTSFATGLRSVVTGEPMRPNDRFRVGSITKAFTAATLLRLEDEGALSLDDAANQYATGLGLPDDITVLDLLNHTAGLFNYTDDVSFVEHTMDPWTEAEIIAWSLDPSLIGHGYIFAPETDYKYSNTNYLVAGLVIESVTGVPFHEAMRARTIDVVGLDATGIDGFEVPMSDYVDGHQGYDEVVTGRLAPTWGWAAGGMIANGRDACRWAEAVYRGDLLSPEDRARMRTPTALSIASGIDVYGLGTMVVTRAGRTVIGHTGKTMGFRAEVFIDVDTGTCVSVLANDFFSSPSIVSEPVWEALAGY